MRRTGTPIFLLAAALITGVGSTTSAAQVDTVTVSGVSATVYTSDANPGGKGVFENLGEHLKACDIQNDGYRAVTTFLRSDTGQTFTVQDADGANGNCVDNNLSLAEGTEGWIQVCLQNGSSGPQIFCTPWWEWVQA